MPDEKTKQQTIEEVKSLKEKTSDKNLQQAIAEKAEQMKNPVSK